MLEKKKRMEDNQEKLKKRSLRKRRVLNGEKEE